MNRNKFAIGQIVDFDSRVMPAPRPNGPFEVVRVLPAEDSHSQTYRIKSKAEPFERSAKEYELMGVVASPSTEQAASLGGWLGADPMRRLQAARPVRTR
jgi:hypothetical protein